MDTASNKKHKVLIIKVGYSETLDSEISSVTSYGDVLRTTVLLNLFQNDHVTWLVDEKAFPIIKQNPYINRPLIYNLSSVLQLQNERFDTVINLEKVPGLCALADSVPAWRRFGFRFDPGEGIAEAYDGTQDALEICFDENRKRHHQGLWQEILYSMVGAKWNGEGYVFGYQPPSRIEEFDIGFNYLVGPKWPSKGWPDSNWKTLENMLKDRYVISWQQGAGDMNEYFNWIAKCRVLITNDSFGLHVALALKKRVVAMFCSTNPYETFLYNRGIALFTEGLCDKQPCYSPKCLQNSKLCEIGVEPVAEAVEKMMRS